MSDLIEVLHHIPGRIRLRIARLRHDLSTCRLIEEMAPTFDGIERVETNPLTGSIVVHYDRAAPDIQGRLDQALDALNALLAMQAQDDSEGARGSPEDPPALAAVLALLLGAGGLILLGKKIPLLGSPAVVGGLLLSFLASPHFDATPQDARQTDTSP